MAKIDLEPYIFFNGNCREAMDFYKSVFGGELTMQKLSEVPPQPGMEIDESRKDEIMHASLKGDVNLMASDSKAASPEAKKVTLSLGGTDEQKMRQIFDALSEGGQVISALKKEFWGDTFGMLKDKFGVEWMMNIGSGEQPSS